MISYRRTDCLPNLLTPNEEQSSQGSTPRSSFENISNELKTERTKCQVMKRKLSLLSIIFSKNLIFYVDKLEREQENNKMLETRIQKLITEKQDHLIKIANLLNLLKDKNKEKENNHLQNKVEELMAILCKSDDSKVSMLALELEKKDDEITTVSTFTFFLNFYHSLSFHNF